MCSNRVAILLPALLLAVLPGPVHASLDQARDSLAERLASAGNGDTIRIARGVHRGLFVVSRRVHLRGDSGAVLDGEGRGTVLTLRADSITISGITVRGAGRSLDRDEAAIKVERCSGCSITSVKVERALHGIYLLESNRTLLADNTILGDSALAEPRRGNGIHLFNSSGNRIRGNHIESTRDGIYFSFASGNAVDSNFVTGVRYGLHYMYSNDNSFVGNIFTRNAAGAAIMFSNNILFRGNEFSRHIGYRAYGILIQTSSHVTAENNVMSGNLVGIFVDNSNDNFFRNNRVEGNGIGVDLLPSAWDNTFAGNSFAHNRTPVRVARGSGRSTWAEHGRGNYWGSSAVFDLDGDGIGDRPFRVGDAFATLAQPRPALELFAGTPAARALSWADEAFPAFTLLRIEDPAPLVRHGSAGAKARSHRKPAYASLSIALLGILISAASRARRGRGAASVASAAKARRA